jgi:hypothetical protein
MGRHHWLWVNEPCVSAVLTLRRVHVGGCGWGGGGGQDLICNPKYIRVLNINMADAHGLSPIMLCVKYERTKLLYYLLEAGADFEQQNLEGMTVLTLLNQWMSERGSDLRLEKEVINHAIERVRACPICKFGQNAGQAELPCTDVAD